MTSSVGQPIRVVACAVIGIVIRLVVTFNFKETLRQRVEISTPINDWRRATEGIFKWNSDLDPYSGNLFHEYPISLQFYKIISNYFGADMIFAITDVVTALLLHRAILNQMIFGDQKGEHAKAASMKTLLIYLFSPISVISCAGQSTAIFTNFLFALICFLLPMRPFRAFTCVLCALLAFNNIHYSTLILPILLCMEFYNSNKRRRSNSNNDPASQETTSEQYYNHQDFFQSLWTSISICLISIVTLLITSYLLMGNSWSFLRATYGFVFYVEDLTPNIGMFWYFFTEMFEHFLEFFTWIVQINAFIHVIPISIRFREDPFFALYITIVTSTIFQPYPNLTNIGLITSMTPQFSALYPHMKNGLKTVCTAITAMSLWPIFWHLWINMGTANANFYFGATLVFNAALVLFVVDLLNAKVHVKAKARLEELKQNYKKKI